MITRILVVVVLNDTLISILVITWLKDSNKDDSIKWFDKLRFLNLFYNKRE